MRIRSVGATVEEVATPPGAAGYPAAEALRFVRCRVETEDGAVGWGVTGRFLAEQVAALLRDEVHADLVGRDALAVEAIGARLVARRNPRGGTGVFASALSALDIALWDLRGLALGQPVWRLLGAARASVPAYATVGFPAMDQAALVSACRAALAEGYAGVKVLVGAGGRTLAEDAARVRAVRAAIGPSAALMIDANCAFNPAEAKRLCAMLRDCDLFWFEEPLIGNDVEALAALRRAVEVPLASGQMIQSRAWFRDVLARGALDWLHPNAAFCGGITGALRVLALAESFGVPVATAGGWDAANLPVMAGHAHGGMIEVHAAHAALHGRFSQHPEPRDGLLHPSDQPGIGFRFAD